MSNVSYDARGMMAKFRRLEESAQSGVKAVIKGTTQQGGSDVRALVSKPVGRSNKVAGGKVRSKPGQAPRSDSGRFRGAVKTKVSPKGWVGTITTDGTAVDSRGRRYPFMLESGTQKMKKRPSFKKVQRKLKRPFNRAMAEAVSRAVQRADR